MPSYPRLIASLLALGAVAFSGQVSGSDSAVPACRELVPWILEEPADTPSQNRFSTALIEASSLLPDPPVLESASPDLDVATYNLHSGLGLRHAFFSSRAQVERNLREIARAIAATGGAGGPDIVALNEVDFGSRRSGWVDEAQFVADELEALTGSTYQVFRGETWRRNVPGLEVRFGNAALVRLPVLFARACLFENLDGCDLRATGTEPVSLPRGNLIRRLFSEPRGVIRLSVELDGSPVDVLVTHLDAFDMRAREAQATLLLTRFLVPGRTTVLLGDMNAVPTLLTRARWMFSEDRTHAILATGSLADASITFASHRQEKSLAAWATYPADAPIWGLDWVLGSLDLSPQTVATIGEAASDHRGLYVRYRCLRDDAEIEASRVRHGRICERLRSYDSNCPMAGG